MKWLRAFAAGALVALAAVAAVLAESHRRKAQAIADQPKGVLLDTVVHGTGRAQKKAKQALAHIERGQVWKGRAHKLMTKGANQDASIPDLIRDWNRISAQSDGGGL